MLIRWLIKLLGAFVVLIMLLAGGLSLTGLLGRYYWLLDLTNQFKPYYFSALIITMIFLLLLQQKRWALVNLFLVFITGFQLLSFYLPLPRNTNKPASQIKLIQFNVCAPSKDFGPVSKLIEREKPDLVVLEECNTQCYQTLNQGSLKRFYPGFYRSELKHRLVVLSRFPLLSEKVPHLHAKPAVMLLTFNVRNQAVTLLAMHSTRPSSGEPYYRNQIKQFEQIASIVRLTKHPFLLVGDLNTTPWGYSFRKLLTQSGLKNSMVGFGIQPTFPVFVPHFPQAYTFPMVTIDHVLTSEHFIVLSRRNGPRLNSDHLPVIVEVGLEQVKESN